MPRLLTLAVVLLVGSAVADPPGAWLEGLVATHYWDCNGAGCDSTVLQPWNPAKYSSAAQYTPLDPAKYGGDEYGERLWMTGAASDYLAELIGRDDGCCGADTASGGCGGCLLVRNPAAVRSDWTAVVMKKNRCPPWTNGCDQADSAHFDLAVPGYDNLQFSTANVCGSASVSQTFINEEQSAICGDWYAGGAASTIEGCDCSALPDATPEQALMRSGCELFTSWGWRSGNPTLQYQAVTCPDAFKAIVSAAFSADGAQPVLAPTAPPAPTPSVPTPSVPTPSVPDECTQLECGCDWATAALCNPAGDDGTACWRECCCRLRAGAPVSAPPTFVWEGNDNGEESANSSRATLPGPAAAASIAAAGLCAVVLAHRAA